MTRRKPEHVRIRVRTSFNDLVRGDTAMLELTPKVQGWLNARLVEVVSDGTGEAGSGSAEQGDHERVPAGVEGSGTAGGEPGEGFGTGEYGTSEG